MFQVNLGAFGGRTFYLGQGEEFLVIFPQTPKLIISFFFSQGKNRNLATGS